MIIQNKSVTLFGDNPNNGPATVSLVTVAANSWSPYYRLPWSDIPSTRHQSCNLAFTINADCRVDFDVYDRKVSNPKLLDLIFDLKKKGIVKKITCVYEYGEKGKKHGKLHYHGIAQMVPSKEQNNREIFEKAILKVFNKNLNVRHRTLHTKLFKTVEDRTRYLKYMSKEEHNKKKCLISI